MCISDHSQTYVLYLQVIKYLGRLWAQRKPMSVYRRCTLKTFLGSSFLLDSSLDAKKKKYQSTRLSRLMWKHSGALSLYRDLLWPHSLAVFFFFFFLNDTRLCSAAVRKAAPAGLKWQATFPRERTWKPGSHMGALIQGAMRSPDVSMKSPDTKHLPCPS